MTNIADKIVKRRVRVDWDGDGFLNEGVLQSAPPNLFPAQLYTDKTFLYGQWNFYSLATASKRFLDQLDDGGRGLLKRRIDFGTASVITAKFMWNGYAPFQAAPTDPPNLLVGSAQFDFDSYEWMGGVMPSQSIAIKPYPSLPIIDPGDLGYYVGTIPYLNSANPLPASGNFWCLGLSATNNSKAHTYDKTGFIDVPQQYTNALTATSSGITWGGFPTVTPGATYTIAFQVFAPAEAAIFGATSANIQIRLYSDGGSAASPNFTRQYMGGSTVSVPVNTWTDFLYVFTVPSGGTHIALDLVGASGLINGIQVGGLMLMAGNQFPTRFWDTGVVYTEPYFSYVFPGDSSPYVITYWVKSPNGIDTYTPTLKTVTIGTSSVSSVVLPDVHPTSSWQRVDVAVPASANNRGVWLEFNPIKKGGVSVGLSNQGSMEFDGFMITKGSALYPYHVGTLYGYDDISDYVIDISTRSGKSSFTSALPSEGTATIKLRNDDKRFSPSNVDSPMYGYLNPNLKVKVQLYDNVNNVWVDAWSGWTYEFDVTPGTNQDNQAEMTCQQGIYRLAEGSINVPIKQNTSADVMAKAIIEGSGWRSSKQVLQSFVGFHTLVGENAYTMDTTLLYNTVEEGINNIEMSGRDWSQSTDPRKALEDVLKSENAMMFINRDGSISIFNRNHWIENDADDTFKLDTNVNQAEYGYGQDIINAAEVTIVKNKALTNQPVWESKRPIAVIPNQVWIVDLNPAFTEGRSKTVISYTLDGMVKDVYTKDTGLLTNTTGVTATQAQADNIKVELLGVAGERPRIRVTNKNNVKLWVHLKINGSYIDTGDGLIVKVEDATSIDTLKGRHVETFSSNVLSDDREAASYGEFLIQRQSMPLGEFPSFAITVRSQEDYNRVLSLGVGSIVTLSEIQSSEEGLHHAIIGEDISIDNSRTLTITYHTARTLQEDYYKADISVLGDGTLNMIPAARLLRAKSTNGGVFGTQNWQKESLTNIMYWRTGVGHDNKLVLAPARDQLVVYYPITDLLEYPLTGTAGATSGAQSAVLPFGTPVKRVLNAAPYNMPLGQDKLTWFTPDGNQRGTSITSAQAYIGMRFNTMVDPSLATAIPTTLYPVLPDAKYIARLQAYLGDVNLLPAGSSSDGLRWGVLNANRSNLNLTQWNSLSAVAGTTPVTEQLQNYTHYDQTFRARLTSGELVKTIGFNVYFLSAVQVWQREALVNAHLLRYSDYGKVSGTFLDTTVSHKYTLYARTDPGNIAVSYTLTVIAEDGSTIGTDAKVVSTTTPTKFEVNIPSGNKSAWAYLTKTTNDYRDTKIYIYGYGITLSSVSSYLDLSATEDIDTIFA